jgi:hypothetical protein
VDRGVRKAGFRSHRADRPVRRVGRRCLQRSLDHGGNLIVVDGARPARAGFVKQAITAILQKWAPPSTNVAFMDAEFGSHGGLAATSKIIIVELALYTIPISRAWRSDVAPPGQRIVTWPRHCGIHKRRGPSVPPDGFGIVSN